MKRFCRRSPASRPQGEVLRDTIANFNGMYRVLAVVPAISD